MLTYTLPHAELNLPHDSLYKHYRQKLEPKPWTSKWEGDYPNTEDAHASFAAMVAQLDEYVGEVEAKLKQLGIADNTIVIFASDNGPHREEELILNILTAMALFVVSNETYMKEEYVCL